MSASSRSGSIFSRLPQARPTADLEDARIEAAVRQRLFGQSARPLNVGRFSLVQRLGSGGAGEVWAAHDPKLERRVAIKILHGGAGEESPTRDLMTEAQLAGRLSHPNIVSVFDAGTIDGRVWIAMEFVDGPDLAAWLTRAPRPRPAVTDVLMQAGRGLAEAHDHGIVHGDFKPANVMLDVSRSDPRAKVVDFGLARLGPPGRERAVTRSDAETDHRSIADPLGGTPAYMAPEQRDGEPSDMRSDQFSFCVTVCEALCGRRPFRRVGDFDLVPGVLSRLPVRMRGPVRRGLSRDAAERWPSMGALLGAIAPRPRWPVLAAAAVLAAGGAALTVAASTGSGCTDAGSAFVGWSAHRRESVAAGFRRTELQLAADTWARVEPRLDDFAAATQRTREKICEGGEAGLFSDALVVRAHACVARSEQRFEAFVQRLQRPTLSTLESAVPTAAGLSVVVRCADLSAPELAIELPADPQLLAAVETGRRFLAEADALRGPAHGEERLARIGDARDQLAPRVVPVFDVEVELARGRHLEAQGQHRAAGEALLAAYAEAEALEHHAAKLEAAITLADVLVRRDPERSRWWASIAIKLAERARADEALLRALLQAATAAGETHDDASEAAALQRMLRVIETSMPNRADWYATIHLLRVRRALRRGQLDEAQREAEGARTVSTTAFGPSHPRVAQAEALAGVALRRSGAWSEARQHLEAALEIWVALGEDDEVRVAEIRSELALLADIEGRLEEARDEHVAALAILERAVGQHSAAVATVLENLGIVQARLRDDQGAEATFRRALAINEGLFGRDGAPAAFSHSNLATLLADTGRFDAGLPHARRAVEIRRHALAPGHPKTAVSLTVLGDIQRNLDALDDAIASFDDAIAMTEAAEGEQSSRLPDFLARRARVEVLRGETQAARRDLGRAVAIDAASPDRGDPMVSCHIRFEYGRLLHATGSHAEAYPLVHDAKMRAAQLGEAGAEVAIKIDRWLAVHPRPR